MTILALLISIAAADSLAEARGHLNHGRYEESITAWQQAEKAGLDSTAIALGLSRAYIETGSYDKAAALLSHALQKDPWNADLLARRGELQLLRGDARGALQSAESALAREPEHVAAHWVRADALTESGRIDEATEDCRWFVRYYNRVHPGDSDTLVYVARGALRYARWKRVSSIFHFVIGELCPDLAKAEAEDWRADAISGALLLEKYNAEQGIPDLERALAKNPGAAEVYVALAAALVENRDFDAAAKRIEAALETNPSCVPALGLKSDLAIAAADFDAARQVLAAALAVNPHDQEILARKVSVSVMAGDLEREAFDRLITGIETGEPSQIERTSDSGRLVAELLQRNPKPGPFLFRIGVTLEQQRFYVAAERAFEAAIRVMPQLPEPQVALALLVMRDGDFRRARPMLDAAFKADPFHVRVGNMRKVVKLLEGYDELETPHFVIRFDPQQDRVLAELAGEFLEEAYPQVTQEFGYEPQEKTVVELFHTGHGQSGQQWFSARMVGLPWLQTIGASTGLMIAMTAPTSGMAFNWAAVARHEFVHVVTLQQTDFRIPHWYTEALAVRSEGFPRPELWDELLRERVPAGELRTLDDLNVSFTRPGSPEDWQFAYCQSLLYAEYIDERFDPRKHRELLESYVAGRSTDEAIVQATGLSPEQFDAGYREKLAAIVSDLGPARDDEVSQEAAAVLKQVATALRERDEVAAIALLDGAIDRQQPQPRLLELLGKLKLKHGDADGATALFSLGRERFPHERLWLKLLAASRLRAEQSADLVPLLEELAGSDANDALAAKKLAEIARSAGDAAAMRRWAMRALQVAPHDVELHELLEDACMQLGDAERAATARRHADLLRGEESTTGERVE